MRQDIDTAPRDGRAIVLEDGPSGTYQIAEWSKDAGSWVEENGDPVKMTPAYWHALPDENHAGSENASIAGGGGNKRRVAMLMIGFALLAAIGIQSKPYLETNVSPQAIGRDAGLYLSRIDQFSRVSIENASVLAARGLASVREFVRSQEWLVELGRIGANLGSVWQNEMQRQAGASRQEGPVAEDGIATLANNEPASTGAVSTLAEAGELRTASVLTARISNADESFPGQLDEERAQSQAIKAELEVARRQIELNTRLLDESRDLARLEKIAIEENGRQHVESLLRYIEVLRHAQEVSTGALNGARNEAQEQKLRAERAVADARRERERGRLLAKQLAEARLEIDTRTAALNELRRNAEKPRQDVERRSVERQPE